MKELFAVGNLVDAVWKLIFFVGTTYLLLKACRFAYLYLPALG